MNEKIDLLNIINQLSEEEQQELAKKIIELINKAISSKENINLNVRIWFFNNNIIAFFATIQINKNTSITY